MAEVGHFKDSGLARLSQEGHNVAQFVSYDPDGNQRYSRVVGQSKNHEFDSQEEAVDYLLRNSTGQSVNVRSYDPADPKSKPFRYGNTTLDQAMGHVRELSAAGLHLIVNETIDIDDGGVSGVAFGNVIEFAPHDTPRCVEKPGTAQFTRAMGADVLRKVYGFQPDFAANPDTRLEFSIHPLTRGYRDGHTIIWEAEQAAGAPLAAELQWPNRFSDMLGDKTFGLLVADSIGLHVPHTEVFNRTVAPFSFGQQTGSKESWLRTAPNKQTPGLYTTVKGWTDPYKLMANEDPTHENIASVLRQDNIAAQFSGAAIMGADGKLLIEGTSGQGDSFMVGEQGIVQLPDYLQATIQETYKQASDRLGPVRFEWVYDGTHVWVVQLHRGISASAGETIYPETDNQPTAYLTYDTAQGIDGLRTLIEQAKRTNVGITLNGNVGITSHFGDLLRKAEIPSRINRVIEEL